MMKFIAWVEYSGMMFCVSKTEDGFVCEKYIGGSKVHQAIKEVDSTEELERLLLSIPNAPQKYIHDLIERLKDS